MTTEDKVRFSTVDDYIALQPAEVRATLEQLRQVIRTAAPNADELISYQMPAFRFHGKLVWFAAYKNHYAIYVIPDILQVFKAKLTAYELTKSAIRFPLGSPVPEQLITEIITYAVNENLRSEAVKKAAGSKKARK